MTSVSGMHGRVRQKYVCPLHTSLLLAPDREKVSFEIESWECSLNRLFRERTPDLGRREINPGRYGDDMVSVAQSTV